MAGVNDFSVGRDITVNINTANGPLRLTGITGFQSAPNTEKDSVRTIDGVRHPLVFPDGWNGTFDVTRKDSTLDDFWDSVEAAYYAGQGIPGATITETITETDGSVNQYKYLNAILVLDAAGDWKGNSPVAQRMTFEAQRRIKVA